MDYIVSYSGGIGSFNAAYRLKQEMPDAAIKLVFCDTLIEDEDLYRFLDETATALELTLIKLQDGRNPWEVFCDVKFQGNTRIAPCSRILKREVMGRWLKENYPDNGCILVLGIDWQEKERLERAQKSNPDYQVIAPLCDKPWISDSDKFKHLKQYGIEPPRLYKMGFPHNNCGGFCVRAGLAQFKLLKEQFPERFEWHKQEQDKLTKKVPNAKKPFLRKTINGKQHYITLREFEFLELGQADQYDFGGCGCFIDV